MTLDPNAFASMLKQHYASGVVQNLAYSENPGWAAIGKQRRQTAGGSAYVQPIGTSLVGGGSSTFSTANAYTANQSNFGAFTVPRIKHYRVPKIDNELIEATLTGSEDAFEKATDEVDRGIKAEANWLNFRLYRSRGGAIGRMTNTGFATTAMTVDDPAALFAVQPGDVLKLASTDGTSGATRAGSLTVAGVTFPSQSGATATITLTGNISAGVAAAAANDYIFLDGDFGLAPAGFADYIPDTAGGAATALFGLTRSVDNRLGGAIVDGATSSMYELITDMLTATAFFGGATTGMRTIFASPFAAGDLVKQLDGKWTVQQASGMNGEKLASIGYKAVKFSLMGLEAQLILDRMCPVNRLYAVDLDDWAFLHAGAAPAFLLQKQTGSILKPSETADAWECRIGEYGNFVTSAPHRNIVGKRG